MGVVFSIGVQFANVIDGGTAIMYCLADGTEEACAAVRQEIWPEMQAALHNLLELICIFVCVDSEQMIDSTRVETVVRYPWSDGDSPLVSEFDLRVIGPASFPIVIVSGLRRGPDDAKGLGETTGITTGWRVAKVASEDGVQLWPYEPLVLPFDNWVKENEPVEANAALDDDDGQPSSSGGTEAAATAADERSRPLFGCAAKDGEDRSGRALLGVTLMPLPLVVTFAGTDALANIVAVGEHLLPDTPLPFDKHETVGIALAADPQSVNAKHREFKARMEMRTMFQSLPGAVAGFAVRIRPEWTALLAESLRAVFGGELDSPGDLRETLHGHFRSLLAALRSSGAFTQRQEVQLTTPDELEQAKALLESGGRGLDPETLQLREPAFIGEALLDSSFRLLLEGSLAGARDSGASSQRALADIIIEPHESPMLVFAQPPEILMNLERGEQQLMEVLRTPRTLEALTFVVQAAAKEAREVAETAVLLWEHLQGTRVLMGVVQRHEFLELASCGAVKQLLAQVLPVVELLSELKGTATLGTLVVWLRNFASMPSGSPPPASYTGPLAAQEPALAVRQGPATSVLGIALLRGDALPVGLADIFRVSMVDRALHRRFDTDEAWSRAERCAAAAADAPVCLADGWLPLRVGVRRRAVAAAQHELLAALLAEEQEELRVQRNEDDARRKAMQREEKRRRSQRNRLIYASCVVAVTAWKAQTSWTSAVLGCIGFCMLGYCCSCCL